MTEAIKRRCERFMRATDRQKVRAVRVLLARNLPYADFYLVSMCIHAPRELLAVLKKV